MLSIDGSSVYAATVIAYNVRVRKFTVGDVIRKARKDKKWDQERLGREALRFQISGDETKVNKATISKIEGKNPYTSEFGVIWRVLAALDLTFADVERLTGAPFIEAPGEGSVPTTKRRQATR